jgi:hypothetical protein
MTVDIDDKATTAGEIILEVEEVEEVIAPKITTNHNETLVGDEVELSIEEMEELIALGMQLQHNETLVGDEVELNAD